MRGFNFLHSDHEISRFASHIFAVVIRGKCQWEGFAFASFHATRSFFKFLEHLTIAQNKLKVFSFAAFKGFAIDLAFKIHRDTVAILGGCIMRTLRKSTPLFAQDINRFFDRSVRHFGRDFFNLSLSQITDLDFWKHLKHSFKAEFIFWCTFFFTDFGLTRHAQLGFIGRVKKGFANLVIHHFVLNGITIALCHHLHGDFAWTKTVHLHGASQFFQPGTHLRLNDLHRQAQSHFAFKLFKSFNNYGHGTSPKLDR